MSIYYASSDSRMHVTATTLEQMIDYMLNAPDDGFTTAVLKATVPAHDVLMLRLDK